jgi:phosphate transport system protein
MTREHYSQELADLRGSVVAMASMTNKAIDNAVTALTRRDVRLAEQVVAADGAINEHRWRTEEQALLLIATQAPMASDLRMIAAVIHIVTDLERMADHAAGIAKIAIQTADQPPLKPLIDIPRMSEIARTMLHDAITAFIEDDEAAARAIVARDDEVDALYEQIYRELLTFMLADPTTIDQATHLLWAAHNLERIADRVTNICERVVFAVTGQLEELAVSTY